MEEPESPTLLQCWLEMIGPWQSVFAQNRMFVRAARQALGSLLVLGRASVSRILWTSGREQKSWSGEYFLHSRAQWDPQALFLPLLKEGLTFCPGKLVGVAVDDTRLRKTGRSIPQAAWHRDPMSPPFHTNLMLGLRFLQASLLLPLHRNGSFSARAIPIRFEEVSTVKKPGKRASDGSFCNRTVLAAILWNRTAVPKQPALAVAAYSALMLAALKVFGAERSKAYAQLPKWRRNARRPSCLDLITLLRKEASQRPELVAHLHIQPLAIRFVAAAAA